MISCLFYLTSLRIPLQCKSTRYAEFITTTPDSVHIGRTAPGLLCLRRLHHQLGESLPRGWRDSTGHSCQRHSTYGLSRKTWGRFLNEAYLRRTYLQGRMHVLAGTDARTCKDGCTYLRERLLVLAWRMQCTAEAVAVHCGSGCSALRERLQCTASEMSKTGTEIVSPILDKRKGRRDTPHMGHFSHPDLSGEHRKGVGGYDEISY